jgi:hypothetical protein
VLSNSRAAGEVRIIEGGLSVCLPTGEDSRHGVAAINAVLVGAGVKVFRITPRAHRLEDVYMTHVGASAQANAAQGEI